jgi:CRP-like cAMP-binding protein
MTLQSQSRLAAMLPKLERWAPFSAGDRAAVGALPHALRRVRASQYIVREGDRSENCSLLLSGFAYRSKIVADGGRQILAVLMAGDMVDFQNSLLDTADHHVQAMTDVELALIPRETILGIAAERPVVGRAIWHDTLVDGSIQREWTVNVGRRDARTRLAHLLCEFALRARQAGLGELCDYQLPMTQEHLADCLGLTPVHVNRTLKGLERDGLLGRRRRNVQVRDWEGLARAGDFSDSYLHLGTQDSSPEARRVA